MKISSPKSKLEFENYYRLRWQVLRAPWNQPEGSERDELEDTAYHIMACGEDTIPVGVGRLHIDSSGEAHIRYMAVAEPHRRQSIGSAILTALEAEARNRHACHIMLNARESAIPFYRSAGYETAGPSHTLFGTIRHVRMVKNL